MRQILFGPKVYVYIWLRHNLIVSIDDFYRSEERLLVNLTVDTSTLVTLVFYHV